MLEYGCDVVESCNRSVEISDAIELNNSALKSVYPFGWKRFYVKKTEKDVRTTPWVDWLFSYFEALCSLKETNVKLY